MAMHSSSAAEYVEYDHYLIKKWEYSGFDKNDNIYVVKSNQSFILFSLYLLQLFHILDLVLSLQNTKPKSRVARSAKRFYGFRLSTQGKFFLSLPKTKPDMSKMVY